MKKLVLLFNFLLFLIFFQTPSLAQNMYEQATGGKCKTASCYSKYTYRQATGGECETASCYSK